MIGGYLSFQGWHGQAGYAGTPVEEALPVLLSPSDDRREAPEGVEPVVVAEHPLLRGLPRRWPYLLGWNRVRAKPQARVLAEIGDDPLLVLGTFGRGRSLAWTTDVGPHWCPQAFLDWDGYATLWGRLVRWLAAGEAAL